MKPGASPCLDCTKRFYFDSAVAQFGEQFRTVFTQLGRRQPNAGAFTVQGQGQQHGLGLTPVGQRDRGQAAGGRVMGANGKAFFSNTADNSVAL